MNDEKAAEIMKMVHDLHNTADEIRDALIKLRESQFKICDNCARYGTSDCYMHIERLWELKPDDYCSQFTPKIATINVGD